MKLTTYFTLALLLLIAMPVRAQKTAGPVYDITLDVSEKATGEPVERAVGMSGGRDNGRQHRAQRPGRNGQCPIVLQSARTADQPAAAWHQHRQW